MSYICQDGLHVLNACVKDVRLQYVSARYLFRGYVPDIYVRDAYVQEVRARNVRVRYAVGLHVFQRDVRLLDVLTLTKG